MVGCRERQALRPPSEQMDFDLRMASGEQLHRGHTQLEPSTWGIGTAEEANAGARGRLGRSVESVAEVSAKVEVVGRHPVVAPQHLGEPSAGSHAVETEAVGGLGQQGLGAGRVERRLVVLNEVEAGTPGV